MSGRYRYGNALDRLEALGVPKESRDAFTLLAEKERIPRELAESLKKMVGVRNIAIHDYRAIDFDIVEGIIERNSPDFRQLIRLALEKADSVTKPVAPF